MLRSHPQQKLRIKTTTAARIVGTKLVSTSARVTLARMKEVPRRLRSTVLSVISNKHGGPANSHNTDDCRIYRADGSKKGQSRGEKKSNHAFVQLEKKLEQAEKKLDKMSKKMTDLLSRGPRRNLKATATPEGVGRVV